MVALFIGIEWCCVRALRPAALLEAAGDRRDLGPSRCRCRAAPVGGLFGPGRCSSVPSDSRRRGGGIMVYSSATTGTTARASQEGCGDGRIRCSHARASTQGEYDLHRRLSASDRQTIGVGPLLAQPSAAVTPSVPESARRVSAREHPHAPWDRVFSQRPESHGVHPRAECMRTIRDLALGDMGSHVLQPAAFEGRWGSLRPSSRIEEMCSRAMFEGEGA